MGRPFPPDDEVFKALADVNDTLFALRCYKKEHGGK